MKNFLKVKDTMMKIISEKRIIFSVSFSQEIES